jgi:hypothetical protein
MTTETRTVGAVRRVPGIGARTKSLRSWEENTVESQPYREEEYTSRIV